MNKIKFKYELPYGDRRHYIDEEDVKVVLSRLPEELYHRLNGIFFKDHADGNRILGYVTKGRNDIVLCALPPRISLIRALRNSQKPSLYGAKKGCQWPTIAVRRFILYNTLIHEIGHLQLVNRKSKTVRRKYAGETKAEDFANYWGKKLLSEQFDHPDPVHNQPSAEELYQLNNYWSDAHNEYKKGLILEGNDKRELAITHYKKAVDLYYSHSLALEALGIYYYDSVKSPNQSLGYLKQAVEQDPTLHDANLFLGLCYSDMDMEQESRVYFERAMRLSNKDSGTMSVYAREIAKWGYWEEAEKLFNKAVKKDSKDPFVLHLYERFLLNEKNPNRDTNNIKKIELFSDKDFKVFYDRISIYSRGLRILYRYKNKKI